MGLKDLLGGGGGDDDDEEGKDGQGSFGQPMVDPAKLNVAGGGTVSNMTPAGPAVDPEDGVTGGDAKPGGPAERDHDL